MLKWILGALAVVLLALLTIAGSDKLFMRAVPLEQRLTSPRETIRRKAQQELLGLSTDQKHDVADKLIPSLGNADPFVRKWTAIAMALVGPASQDAIPALLHGVTDLTPDVAQACKVALSEIGTPDPSQLPTLLQGLHDPNEAVRCEAATGISRMGPAAQGALPVMIDQLRADQVPDCLLQATSALVTLVPQNATDLLALLQDPNAAVRRRAVRVLSMIEPQTPERIAALCQTLATDQNSRVRWAAARALSLREPPDRGIVPTLGEIVLGAKKQAVRQVALELLKKTDWTPGAQIHLYSAVLSRDSSADMRWRAAQELAAHTPVDRSAAPALLRALKDDDPRVRQTALLALRQMSLRNRDLVGYFAHLQRDPVAEIRCLAAEQLVTMGAWDRVSVGAMANDLEHEIPESCAGDALTMDGHFNAEVVPALMKLLRSPSIETRRRAVYVLMNLGARAQEALPLLDQARRDQVPGAAMAQRAVRDALPSGGRRRHGHGSR